MKVNPNTPAIAWFNDRNREKTLILKPPYQRKPVWTEQQKAYLVDTIISGYLIPEIFIHRITDSSGKTIYNVVDGQQRIRSILEFIHGEFTLTEDISPEYPDYAFRELPEEVKQKIWNYSLSVREITDASEEQVRSIFKRMNKNVVPLNAQELRHSTYSGDFIKLMEEIAENEYWAENKIVTAREIRRMTDVQFISELFISMMNGIQDKTKEMDTYYEMYEREFPDKLKWQNRFISLMATIDKIIPEIGKSRWKNKSDYYSLMMAINELFEEDEAHGFKITGLRKELLEFAKKVTEAASKISKGRAFNKSVSSYMNAVTKSTTDKDRRLTRHKILLAILKKHSTL